MSRTGVLVTGARGFIGAHVVRELRRHSPGGRTVIGAGRGTRPATIEGEWVTLGASVDRESLASVLKGVDVVVLAAGRAHIRRETEPDPLAAFRTANVEGARAVASAAAAAGVRRIILLSSVAVYGARTGRLDATTTPAPITPYGISRLEAEEAVRDEAARSETELVVLRLPMVYGPGMKGNPLVLFDAVNRGHPLPLGAIRNERSIMYVGNVAAAVQALLAAPIESPNRHATFLAADAEPVSTPVLACEIAEALGRPITLWPVPARLLGFIARAGTVVLRHRFPLAPPAVHSLTRSLVIDATPLAAVIGARPPFSRHDGLHATAAWYLAERL